MIVPALLYLAFNYSDRSLARAGLFLRDGYRLCAGRAGAVGQPGSAGAENIPDDGAGDHR